jgi:hypothetical protein
MLIKNELEQIGSTFPREHVFSDLQPYVCTFENCSATPFSTRNEWFQHELDSHRRRWECILCDDPRPTFSRKAKVKTHLREHHAGAVTLPQIDLITGACETPMTKFDASACPMCSEWVPPLEDAINLREFRPHLARHLQQVSLEALPLYIEGLAIHGNIGQDDTVVYKTGTCGSFQLPDSGSWVAGKDVLILDNMFDDRMWHVHWMSSGKESVVEGRTVKITGQIAISLGKPSECRSMN